VLRQAYPLLRQFSRNRRTRFAKKLVAGVFAPAFQSNKRPHFFFQSETRFGFRMAGNTKDLIPAVIDLLGAIEENLSYWLLEQLQPGDIFVDVGAHIGYFSLLASGRVGASGGVVAIEASPANFEWLTQNIALNPGLQNIRAVNVAASDSQGTVSIYRGPEQSTGLTSILQRRGNVFEAEVTCAPLVQILTPSELRRTRLIKIDVEGAEFQVVAGLLEFEQNAIRADLEIVVETSKDWVYEGRKGSVDDFIELFRRHGFNTYGMKKEMFVEPASMFRPIRLQQDPGWGYFDLVFSRRDCDTL
jgi:FkbM family methyltransferase